MALQLQLPPEVFDQITTFLPDKTSLLHTRLVCRQFYQQSQTAFGRVFYSQLNLCFCDKALAKLRRVAQDHRLRLHVKKLYVGLVCRFCPDPPEHPPGHGYSWRRVGDDVGDPKDFGRGNVALGDVLSIGHAPASPKPLDCNPGANAIIYELRKILAERLTNCRSVYLTDQVGDDPYVPGHHTRLSITDLFTIILISTHDLPLRSLRVHLRRAHASIDTRQLDIIAYETSNTHAWAESLTTLELGWNLVEDETFAMSLNMISRARHLRTLIIDCHPGEATLSLLRQLATRDLPRITTLSLSSVWDLPPRVLLSMLGKLGNSLESLHLSNILPTEHTTWRQILGEFATLLPKLEELLFRHPMKATSHSTSGTKCVNLDYLLRAKQAPSTGTLLLSRGGRGGVARFIGVRYLGDSLGMRQFLDMLLISENDAKALKQPLWPGNAKHFFLGGTLKTQVVGLKELRKISDAER